jgi:hypothetical protein
MMAKPLILVLLTGCGLLAGCGLREPLRPAEGQSLPPAPALAQRQLTADELLAVPTDFRPLRVDEPLTRSERRPADRFDLPPPDVGGSTDAAPSELEERPQPDTNTPKPR